MWTKTRVRAGRFTTNHHEMLIQDKCRKRQSRPIGLVPHPEVSGESRWCPGGELVPFHRSGQADRSHEKHPSKRQERRHAMQTRRFTRLPGLALAVLLTLLVGSVGADGSKLEGTIE